MRAPVSFRWGVFVLATLALVVVWGGHAQVSRSVLESQTREATGQAEIMVRAFERSTHRTIHEVDIILRSLALDFAEGGLEHARRTIDRGFYDPSLIHHFTILNAAGERIYRSGDKDGAADPGDPAMVAFHQGTGKDLMHIGQPFPGSTTGRPLIRFSRRLSGPDGGFAGVIAANIDPDHLSNVYKYTNIGQNGSVTLIGLDKVIRARGVRLGQDGDGIGTAIPHSRLWEELSRSLSGVYWQTTKTDGRLRAFAYRVVEGYPLVVAVGVAQEDIEAAVADLRRTMFVIALLLSASIVLVSVLLVVQHRAAEQLQAALSVNRDFLARVSHELRTPLNAIIGFSEIIKEQVLGPQAGPRYADYAKDIHDSGQHLLTLINDILDLSRLQAGKLALDLEPVNVAAAIDWATRIIAPQVDAKRIRMDMSVQPGIGHVIADERAVKQMMLNLLSNAVKFTPVGGRILVAVAKGSGGRCHVRVTDNGIGMTPEQMRQALIPFGQASALTTREGQGTGLGLCIVKSLMDAHGGSLRIDSRPGKGSEITLEFAA